MNPANSKKLKILVLNYEYPPLGGGAGVITMHHARELAMQNRVTVVTSSENGSFYEIQQTENLKIVRLKVCRKHHYKSDYSEKIDWLVKGYHYFRKQEKLDFDICIAHFSIPGGALAYFLKKKFGLKYTIVSHGHDIPWFCRKQMFWAHLCLYPLIKFIVGKSEKLFVLSDEMFANARKFLGKKSGKVIRVPNGCDSSVFTENLVNIEKNHLEILFAGRLTDQKQPLLLVDIALGLKQKNIPFNLKIAGDGPLKQELVKKVNRSGLEKEVSILGWVSKGEIPELYKNAEILLAPSLEEGMSISILEALFSGLFVIATPVSGNPELIQQEKTGLICKHGAKSFVEGIRFYLTNREKILKGKDALLKDFRIRYSWGNIVGTYHKELLDVVG